MVKDLIFLIALVPLVLLCIATFVHGDLLWVTSKTEGGYITRLLVSVFFFVFVGGLIGAWYDENKND